MADQTFKDLHGAILSEGDAVTYTTMRRSRGVTTNSGTIVGLRAPANDEPFALLSLSNGASAAVPTRKLLKSGGEVRHE